MVQTLSDIRALLAAHGLQPKHRYGQNFLHDANQMGKIVAAADIQPGDHVLEVGPGTGALTEWLLEAGARVLAVEVDPDLEPVLIDRLGERFSQRFRLLVTDVLAGKHEIAPAVIDALRFDEPSDNPPDSPPAAAPPFKLIANLPYNVASPLLLNLACDFPQMARAVVMIQREVADRLIARPGTKAYGPLGIMLHVTCETRIVHILTPGCFWPQPKVASAVVSIVRRPQPLTRDLAAFRDLLHRVFTQRRKQIGAILGRDLHWPQGVRPDQRAEQLTVEQLIKLTDATC